MAHALAGRLANQTERGEKLVSLDNAYDALTSGLRVYDVVHQQQTLSPPMPLR